MFDKIHMDWPSPLRNKGVFFVKREPAPIPEEVEGGLLDYMTCGDIHPNALDHFCALVEEVVVPIFKNELNMAKFPQCVSDGSEKHAIFLSSKSVSCYRY